MDKDPSIEDILASIRRIINEDEPPPAALTRPEPAAPPEVASPEDVLELVEPIAAAPAAAPGLTGVEATLEAMVREMLKPMLRDWLDTNLPDIVRAAVASEITRISRRD